jgi:hypothetical protein
MGLNLITVLQNIPLVENKILTISALFFFLIRNTQFQEKYA